MFTKVCPICKKTFSTRHGSQRFCSIACPKKGKNNPAYKTGISACYYRRIAFEKYPKQCSVCGTKKKLGVHHKDGNRKNNHIDNLQIACHKCHLTILHDIPILFGRYNLNTKMSKVILG